MRRENCSITYADLQHAICQDFNKMMSVSYSTFKNLKNKHKLMRIMKKKLLWKKHNLTQIYDKIMKIQTNNKQSKEFIFNS